MSEPAIRSDMLDFPTAWAIQALGGLEHDPRCSSVHGLLCDCGVIVNEWEEKYSRYRGLWFHEI